MKAQSSHVHFYTKSLEFRFLFVSKFVVIVLVIESE